jgi:hypothetical protein
MAVDLAHFVSGGEIHASDPLYRKGVIWAAYEN